MENNSLWVPPDVCLSVGTWSPVRFLAHGFVLIKECLFFKDYLQNYEYKTDAKIYITLTEVEAEHFHFVLGYIYNGKIQLSIDNILSIMLTARLLKNENLVELCNDFLKNIGDTCINTIIKPIPNRPNATNTNSTSTINNKLSWFQPSRNTSFSHYQKQSDGAESELHCSEKSDKNNDGKTKAIVFDIACCDGPIKFEKVLNDSQNLKTELVRKRIFPPHSNDSGSFAKQRIERKIQEKIRIKKRLRQNVQMFPCKMCGCKFPSYYFMHKHKKNCN